MSNASAAAQKIYDEMIAELLARRHALRAHKEELRHAVASIADIEARLVVIDEELAAYGYREVTTSNPVPAHT